MLADLLSLIFCLSMGVIIVVGIGVAIQLRQQREAKKAEQEKRGIPDEPA